MSPSPRYVDLQVNGFDGVDFNADALDAEAAARVCGRLCAAGVAGILATVITDSVDAMRRRLQNLCRVRSAAPQVAEMIWGFHIEGPFLNPEPGYIGAHPVDAALPASVDAMERLLEAGEDLVRIVTLAPECDPQQRVTRMLVDRGVRVAAGHCNPTLDELDGAIDAGLSMFTHLGNGCPLTLPRHDNVIQRVLSRADRLWVSFIADGVHVPLAALGNYLRCVGPERAIVVSDAIEAAGRGPGRYRIGDQEVVVDEQLATWAEDKSHLVGSATTMPAMAEMLRRRLRLDQALVDRLVRRNPLAVLGRTDDPSVQPS